MRAPSPKVVGAPNPRDGEPPTPGGGEPPPQGWGGPPMKISFKFTLKVKLRKKNMKRHTIILKLEAYIG